MLSKGKYRTRWRGAQIASEIRAVFRTRRKSSDSENAWHPASPLICAISGLREKAREFRGFAEPSCAQNRPHNSWRFDKVVASYSRLPPSNMARHGRAGG